MPELSKYPIHLGLGATAMSEPEFTGMSIYEGYMKRHQSDGNEARLVAMHSFEKPWDAWEMHPNGGQVVLCTEGEITLIQQIDGEHVKPGHPSRDW